MAKSQAAMTKPQAAAATRQPTALQVPAAAAKPKTAAVKPPATPAKPQAVAARPQPATSKPQAAPAKRRDFVSTFYLIAMFLVAFGLVLFYTYNKGWWGHSIPDSAWQVFTPPEGRCQILMPGEPESTPATVQGEGIISGRRYQTVRHREDAVFALIISDRDAKITAGKSFEEIYVPIHNSLLAYGEGQVLSQEAIRHDGHEGKELQIRLANGELLVTRVILIRGQPYDRIYILIAVGHWSDSQRGDPAKFFNSFKIENGQPVIRPGKEKRRIRVA
jgi:hypothetical protein